MGTRRIIWAASMIITFMLFYSWMPNSLYNRSPLLISFLGAVLFLFFLLQLVADFKSWEEFNIKDNQLQDWRHKYTPILVIPGIVVMFVFLMHFSLNEKAELRQFGQKVIGTIINGTSMTNLKGRGTYEVTVQFYTKEGRLMTVKENVGRDEFNSFSKGQKVELIYSTKDPTMIEILTRPGVEVYTGVKDREITPKDLIRLISTRKDSLTNVLNKINYEWTVHKGDSSLINERKNLLIRVNPDKEITYLSLGNAFVNFPKKLKEQNFNEISSTDKTVKMYENKEFFAAVKLQFTNKTNIVTVITMAKK